MGLFADLAESWSARHAPRPLPCRWAVAEPALASHAALGQLVATIHTDMGAADGFLAALARLARGGDADARTTLLHVMTPGLRRLARSVRHRYPSVEDSAAAVVAAAWEHVCDYPVHRPGNVAANLLLDTLKAVTRRARSVVDQPVDPTSGAPLELERSYVFRNPGEELLDLLAAAVREGHISGQDARLIALTRLYDQSAGTLRPDRHPGTIRRQRRQAELALASRAHGYT